MYIQETPFLTQGLRQRLYIYIFFFQLLQFYCSCAIHPIIHPIHLKKEVNFNFGVNPNALPSFKYTLNPPPNTGCDTMSLELYIIFPSIQYLSYLSSSSSSKKKESKIHFVQLTNLQNILQNILQPMNTSDIDIFYLKKEVQNSFSEYPSGLPTFS